MIKQKAFHKIERDLVAVLTSILEEQSWLTFLLRFFAFFA